MSVITNFPAMPNRLSILCRHLASCGTKGEAKGDLLAVLSPPSLRKRRGQSEDTGATTIAQHVLREAVALELVREDEASGRVTLAFGLERGGDARALDAAVLERLESTLFERESADRTRQVGVPIAVAWLLTRDPGNPPGWHINAKPDIQAEFPGAQNAFDLTDDSRYDNAVYWARYLGYVWRLGGEGRKVVMPDPTEALARHLPALMSGTTSLPVGTVVERWGERCPVLEGGWAREYVEDVQAPHARRPHSRFSKSTSLALKRLEQRGIIRLEHLSDADAWLLDWNGGLEPTSHIRLRNP